MLIDPKPSLSRFARDDEGAVAVIVSLMMTVLLGFVALGVDVASLYRERAQLQAVSDLTAVSAMGLPSDANARADNVLTRNGSAPTALETLETGRFLRNPAIAPENRFIALPADSAGINAVRVVLENDAKLHFARVFTDDTHVTLDRTSLATRTGAASFSLDSHLVHLNPIDLNALLNFNFGASAELTVGEQNVLTLNTINLTTLLETLAEQVGVSTLNPAEILDETVTAQDLIEAMQTAYPDIASDLDGIAGATGSISFSVSSLVGGIDSDLGLTATDFTSQIEMTALDVIKAVIATQSPTAGVEIDTSFTVPSVLTADTVLFANDPPVSSGWIALGEEGTQLHRAALRLKTDINADPTLLSGLGASVSVTQVSLPIHTEVAGATATLEQIGCNLADPAETAALFSTAPTPLHPANGTALAALYLGTVADGTDVIDPSTLEFADILDVDIVIDMGLLPDITIAGITLQGRSMVTIGTSSTDTVLFSHADVAAGDTSRTFGSSNLVTSAVDGLLSPTNTEVRVKPGQEGLISGLAAPIVNSLLAALPNSLLTGLSTPVDSVIDATLSQIGVELGAGELTLTGHHCEPIRLAR